MNRNTDFPRKRIYLDNDLQIIFGVTLIAVMGYNASVLSIGTAGYPALGGVLATFGWHYPFALPWLAIPLGIFVIFLVKDSGPKVQQDMKTYIANTLKGIGNRQVIGIFFASFMTFILLYGPFLTYFPLLMANAFDASPFTIGPLFMGVVLGTWGITGIFYIGALLSVGVSILGVVLIREGQ